MQTSRSSNKPPSHIKHEHTQCVGLTMLVSYDNKLCYYLKEQVHCHTILATETRAAKIHYGEGTKGHMIELCTPIDLIVCNS